MSKEIIDHGFGVIETRETFYTEETIRQKDQRIADLETRLAKSEEERDSNYENYSICWKDNEYLKQQLAEKDEQINMLEQHKFYADNIIQAYADKWKNHNQDKISFAVEQLEKVKEFCQNSDGFNKYGQSIRVECVVDFIDCAIKDLKG